jgi:hypothetical protein
MRILIFFLLSSFFFSLQAQENRPLISSFEAELQRAILDPARGLALKANHEWWQKEKSTFQSGVLLSGLLRPDASPYTSGELQEFNGSFRLQLHSGWTWKLGKKGNWQPFAEGFVGLRSYLIRGSLGQPNQNFDRTFSKFTLLGDFGLRLGVGYQIASRLGIQLAFNASLRGLGNPLGIHTGVLAWGPDNLALVGLGVRYQLE